ncbi:MAG TPA: hypothetical protein VI434_03570 [Candidatus Dormibacteraeota bacterium]
MSEVADTATVLPIRRKSVLVRLDPVVHDALARWAGEELRSTNSQIEFVLRRALVDAGRLPSTRPPRRLRSVPDIEPS